MDCAFDQAGQLRLELPKEAPPRPSPDHVATRTPAGAVLEIDQLQELADRAPDLAELAAGHGLRFRVRAELEDEVDTVLRGRLSQRLAEISADLKLD